MNQPETEPKPTVPAVDTNSWPVARTPLHTTPTVNSPISIFKGELRLTSADRCYWGQGSIGIAWLPSPVMEILMTVDFHALYNASMVRATLELEVPALGISAPVWVQQLTGSAAEKKATARLAPTDRLSGGAVSDVRRVLFHVVNLTSVNGTGVRYPGGSGVTFGRISLVHKTTSILLDPIEGAASLFAKDKSAAGFALTHVGTWELESEQLLDERAIVDTMQLVYQFLSLARGTRCGISLVYGYDANDDVVYRSLYAPSADGYSGKVSSCLSWRDPHSMSRAFPGFVDRMTDRSWRDPLQEAISWYVRSNRPRTEPEEAIVLVQAALELLSWVLLVENCVVLSASGFERLPAADKLRLVLAQAKIDASVPDVYADLRMLLPMVPQPKDGPEVFTFIRNGLVHPTKRNRERLAKIAPMSRYQACQLGLGYLELILLYSVQYKGSAMRRWSRATEPVLVPWATSSVPPIGPGTTGVLVPRAR